MDKALKRDGDRHVIATELKVQMDFCCDACIEPEFPLPQSETLGLVLECGGGVPLNARVHLSTGVTCQKSCFDGLSILGVIDRVDATPEGLCIVDYKTGAIPTKSEIQRCISVQLPLEALILGSVQNMLSLQNLGLKCSEKYSLLSLNNSQINMRVIQLKRDASGRNDVVVPFSSDMLLTVRTKLRGLFTQYCSSHFVFETCANNTKHKEYAHLSRT
jgi:hypothetical protein